MVRDSVCDVLCGFGRAYVQMSVDLNRIGIHYFTGAGEKIKQQSGLAHCCRTEEKNGFVLKA
jgi:hypothetical protein